MLSQEQFMKQVADSADNGFKAFMSQSTVRLLLSQIPETGRETLEVLLKSAFENGHGAGMSYMAIAFIKGMIDPRSMR